MIGAQNPDWSKKPQPNFRFNLELGGKVKNISKLVIQMGSNLRRLWEL